MFVCVFVCACALADVKFAAIRQHTDHNSTMEARPMLDRTTNLNPKVSSEGFLDPLLGPMLYCII